MALRARGGLRSHGGRSGVEEVRKMVISPSKWFHYHILIDVATIYAIECVLTHININIHKYISKNDGFTIRTGDLTI